METGKLNSTVENKVDKVSESRSKLEEAMEKLKTKTKEKEESEKLDDQIEKTVKILKTGDGPIRIGVGLGYSGQTPFSDTWLKPSVYLEVTAPEEVGKTVLVSEYVNDVIEYTMFLLKQEELELLRHVGSWNKAAPSYPRKK